MQNELRKDYVTDNWSIIAPSRSKKPVKPKDCPFCDLKNVERVILKLDKQGKEKDPWQVAVVENMYPITHPSKFKLTGLGTLFTKSLAHGYSEVLIETPEHNKEIQNMTIDELSLVFEAIKRRIEKLGERKKVDHVLIAKLAGPLRGSLEHPHFQIITYPKIPKLINEEIKSFNNYEKINKRCIFCDVIKKEIKSERKIMENEHFVAICPFASRNAYEIWILTKEHKKQLKDLNKLEIFSLVEMIKEVFRRLSSILKPLSYIMVIHESPVSLKHQDFHFHIEIYPSLPKVAHKYAPREVGIRHISVSPEKAASILKKSL